MEVSIKRLANDFRVDQDDLEEFLEGNHNKYGVRESKQGLVTSTMFSGDIIKDYKFENH